jgi:hypothetical protein
MLEFRSFVEVATADDGYGHVTWKEICLQSGFIDGYCKGFDDYITPEFYIGLANIRDGYYSNIFNRRFPTDISGTVRYKLDMLKSSYSIHLYYMYLNEIMAFPWNRTVYGSPSTTFITIATDFHNYYVPSLEALGPPNYLNVRLLVARLK